MGSKSVGRGKVSTLRCSLIPTATPNSIQDVNSVLYLARKTVKCNNLIVETRQHVLQHTLCIKLYANLHFNQTAQRRNSFSVQTGTIKKY